ncbi:complex I NDUFA9 subunit family protein [candidate division KSB1 bacterium]|nr:complex I NDUFA9 subunit family protein [candidate division KSB1 bacterium]RQW05662.1 MAG: complex I NDUFA9 subunit family protein [candidate division KSB1 bacterium]
MRIFLTGATGYVGGFILKELRRRGFAVRCLVRNFSQAEKINADGTEAVIGDVTNPASLEGVLTNCDAVIHLVAIIEENKKKNITFTQLNFEATKNMVDLAKAQGIERFIHMSALGADVNGSTPYYRTKGQAEDYVRTSGLLYTIFRPSFIFGPGDAIYSMLARMIAKVPLGIMPHFGFRTFRHQPVSVFDVANGFVSALKHEKTFRKTYDVGGPQPLTFKEQLRTIAKTIGKKVRLFPLPIFMSRILVGLMSIFPSAPIDQDRLTMLTRDNICDPQPFSYDLRIHLTAFEQGISYLQDSLK